MSIGCSLQYGPERKEVVKGLKLMENEALDRSLQKPCRFSYLIAVVAANVTCILAISC